MTLEDSFNKQLREQMSKKDIKPKELAAALNVPVGVVYMAMKRSGFHTAWSMVRYARAVGCRVEVKLVPEKENK